MNALVVLDFGDYLHPKTRASFEDAARRWGADFVPVTKPLQVDGAAPNPFWQKTLLPFEPAIGGSYERLAVFDGDMLIRDDCPNLFELVPADAIGAVSRYQPMHIRHAACRKHLDIWAKRLNLPVPPQWEYLNGGLVIYSPTLHRRYMEAWREAGRALQWKKLAGNDQSSLSVILHGMQAPRFWLPWEFNAVRACRGPYRAGMKGPMQTFIYHISGTGKKGYHRLVSQCKWRTGTHQPITLLQIGRQP